jgi:hypothetical protein
MTCGVPTDIGFWVCGAAVVTLRGAAKTPWTHLTGSVNAGSTQIAVQDATGWRTGDQIAVAPSEPPTVTNFYDHFDVVTVQGVSGNTITVSPALTYAHPSVSSQTFTNGTLATRTYTAEVLNLTRSGRIEGRPGLRTHFLVHYTSRPATPMVLQNIQFRYLGPQSFNGQRNLSGVLGRWGGPHWHMNGDLTNGTLAQGVVVRDFGNHAFVPHDSNGITLDHDIAFNGYNDAFWYDVADPSGHCFMGPNHSTWTNNVAARVAYIPYYRGLFSGFFMGHGDQHPAPQSSNVAQGNVAVGVQMGASNSAGFEWPENRGCPQGVWRFDAGNVAHNNQNEGIYVWQNDSFGHEVRNFVAYYNYRGILHGAYLNDYLYQDVTLFGNYIAPMILQALSRDPAPNPGLRLIRLYLDAFGRQYALMTSLHTAAGVQPVYIQGTRFSNYATAGIGLLAPSRSDPEWLDVSSATFSGNRYWLLSTIPAASLLVDHDMGLYVRRRDRPGTLMPQWNASTTPVANQR